MDKPRIDWSQLWFPGPDRAFTAEEMARAGSDKPSPTLVTIATINLAVAASVVLQLVPPSQTARVTALLVGLAALGFNVARWLWWRPWRRPLVRAALGVVAVLVAMAAGLLWRLPEAADRRAMTVVIAVYCALLPLLLWFLVMWRSQQIEGRLREQAERERAIEMARRLAAAQLEPHFLFNTLASVQHWVQTGDARAAPLLDSLTGYLRATLPMFDRPLIAAGTELDAVQRYLEVMQARLGERLHWGIDVEPAARAALLPPGLLLTLVENAVQHGLEPRIQGGRVQVAGRLQNGDAAFEVRDDGVGPPPGMQDGIGLANIRQRLALACGDAARLQLGPAAGGGCLAALHLPYRKESTA